MSETTAQTAAPASPTAARPKPKGGGHWYTLDGNPMFEVAKKDGKGMRNTTLADARKLNLLPSVTTILKLLHKEALVNWKIEQAALAVLTAPRKKSIVKDPATGMESEVEEPLDQFVKRVLHDEEQQDEEAAAARDKGKAIHDAIECYFNGKPIPEEWAEYVNGPINAVLQYGDRASSEVIFVGDDYAGTGDLLQDCKDHWYVWDFKSAKKLPDPNKGGAWLEHRLQLSAYAKALQQKLVRAGQGLKPIICANLYISSERPGEYVICEHEGWEEAYELGFKPLVTHWQWQNGYRPENPNREEPEPVSASEPSVELENMRKHYAEANARVAALEKELQAKVSQVTQASDGRSEELERLRGELEKLKAATKAQPVVTPTVPQPARPTLPPAMARPPARAARPDPAKFTPSPTLPATAKDGRKVQWDCGVPSAAPAPTEDEQA